MIQRVWGAGGNQGFASCEPSPDAQLKAFSLPLPSAVLPVTDKQMSGVSHIYMKYFVKDECQHVDPAKNYA